MGSGPHQVYRMCEDVNDNRDRAGRSRMTNTSAWESRVNLEPGRRDPHHAPTVHEEVETRGLLEMPKYPSSIAPGARCEFDFDLLSWRHW